MRSFAKIFIVYGCILDTLTYIIVLLQPVHYKLYTLDPKPFFVNSFFDAVNALKGHYATF